MSVRLSVLMFLQYAILGVWVPVLSPYLSSLSLTYTEMSWVWTASALGAVLAPIVWGQIADRWLAAERCISLCAVVCGATLWIASDVAEPWLLFGLFLTFYLFQMPILSIGSALTFRHLEHPEKQFGPIRLWGTIGWMAASWLLTLWLLQYGQPDAHYADALRGGALFAWTLAVYAFTLPSTPPLPPRAHPADHSSWRRAIDAPLRALQLFRVRAFAVYCVCVFGLYVSWPFNLQMTSLAIKRLLPDQSPWLPFIMTIAQTTEVLTLALLPWILGRYGQKRTMTAGIVCWSLALIALTIGVPAALVFPSLLLHGVYICCFLVAGQVLVNRIAQNDFRASCQGLLVLVNGLGQFVGNFLVGALRDEHGDDYPRIFLPAAIGIAMLALFFVLEFRMPETPRCPAAAEQPSR